MPRKFLSFRSIGAQGAFPLVASFWISVLLSICHITDVNAMIPTVPKLNQTIKTGTPLRTMPAAYKNGWYAEPIRDKSHFVAECEEGYEIVEVHPVPEPYYYDPRRQYPCGVRCWYHRLTSGYCGRGCEYYLYRLGKTRPTCRRRY